LRARGAVVGSGPECPLLPDHPDAPELQPVDHGYLDREQYPAGHRALPVRDAEGSRAPQTNPTGIREGRTMTPQPASTGVKGLRDAEPLEGKVVLVNGLNSDIGVAVADVLLDNGARVAGTFNLDE